MSARKPARSVVRSAGQRGRLLSGVGVLTVTTALLLGAGAASAQNVGSPRPQDSRWWLGAGGGYLAGRSDCDNCEGDTPYGNGTGFLFQGGLRVNERLLVGGEIFSTRREFETLSLRNTYLLALVQFRPFAAQGFFIKGGYGMAFVKDRFTLDGVDETARTWGMGLMYGAGWVFREGSRVSVAPVGAQYVTTLGSVRVSQGTAQNVVINSWFLGAVVMFR